MFPTEMAQCIGGGLRANALSMQFTRNIKPNAQLVLEARAKGLDPTKALTYDDKSKMLKGSIYFPVCEFHYTAAHVSARWYE